MKIIVCLNRDLMSNIAFNLLRHALLEHDVEIFMSKAVGSPNKGIKEITLLEQNLPCDILFPLIEKAVGKPKDGAYYTFNQIKQYDGIKITPPESVNSSNTLNYIKNLAPDLVISIRFGQIFKDEFISIPKHGVINLHSGILPDYKGIMATLQAIIHDEQEVGCTLHYIQDSSIDTGSIIGIAKFEVNKGKSLFWHLEEIYKIGVPMIASAIDDISNGKKIKTTPQDLTAGRYFSAPTQEDEIKLIERGFCIADDKSYIKTLSRYK